MRHALALIAVCCAVVGSQIAQADEGNTTAVPTSQSCTPLKVAYAEKNWRDAKPVNGRTLCPVRRRAGKQNTVRHFYEYRHYREITPYRCLSGREGTFAIPCYIIECESHFDWWAQNPSGALWIYQLLGWGAPAPDSFRDRLRNHEIAASLSLSNWACA